jgi:1-acyl-sn-glycerol-3-phosphate acyltransferase
MRSRLDRYWRIGATGLSFCLFGLGGLLMRVLIFPAINLLVRERRLRTSIARGVIRFAFRGFVEWMRLTGVLSYKLSGLERLERGGLLILANHPTLLDTVFLMALVKHADCIVKSKLWNNPFTHGPVRAAGYINNDNGPELVGQCIDSLGDGGNLIIFPEGTRTPAKGAVNFKRGAANIAVRGMCNVTPIVINCSPPTLGKGDKWWQVPCRRMHFRIEVREDIAIHPFVEAADGEAIAARRLTDYLQDYFAEENERHVVA